MAKSRTEKPPSDEQSHHDLERSLFSNSALSRALFEQTSDAVGVSLNGVHVTANRAYLELFGYGSVEDLSGRPILDLIASTRHHQVIKHVQRRSGGEPTPKHYQTIGLRQDGRTFDIDVHISEFVHDDAVHNLAIIKDISEQKRTQEILRDREAILQGLFRAAPAAILLIRKGSIEWVNDKAHQILNHPPETLQGQHEQTLYQSLTQYHAMVAARASAWSQDNTAMIDTAWRNATGGTCKVRLFATQLNPEVEPTSVVLIALDVTDEFGKQRENDALKERLQRSQKMQAIGTLAGGIAHDFNNMLAAILGYAELAKLSCEVNGAADISDIQEIIWAARRARDLVEQILTFSRKGVQQKSKVLVATLLQDTLRFLSASIPSTIEIDLHISATESCVLADESQIHQVILNLCNNAYQAMSPLGGHLRLRLRDLEVLSSQFLGIPSGTYLLFEVGDTGPGIAPGILDRIFDPFFTTKEVGQGTGIGLSVVHGIVSSLKGTILVDSKLGQGSTFSVYLPKHQGTAAQSSAHSESPCGNESILVVDDEPALANLLGKSLRTLGYDVTTCTDSRTALDLFLTSSPFPDLLITDQTMPNMTGMALMRAIHDVSPETTVIICTGHSDGVDEALALESGAAAFIMKPFERSTIASTVRAVLASRSPTSGGGD